MMCRTVRRRLVAYVDDKLGTRGQRKVAAHLDGCPTCAADVQAVRKLHAVFDASAVAAVPEGLEAEVMRGVRAMVPEAAGSDWLRWFVPLTAGACAVGIAVFLAGRTNGPPEVAQEARQIAGAAAPRVVVDVPEEPGVPPPPARTELAQRAHPHGTKQAIGSAPGEELPSELRDALDLFVDYPIIFDLEKFEHYDSIWANTEEGKAGTTRDG